MRKFNSRSRSSTSRQSKTSTIQARRAAAVAIALAPLAGMIATAAMAANIEQDVNNGAVDLTDPASYTPAGVQTVSSDVTFTATAYSPASFTLNSSETFGSLNDLSATALTITSSSADTLTLGGSGDNGDEITGSVPADLLYIAPGASLTIGATTPLLGLVLGQSGNFDVAGTGVINSAISDGGGGFGITKTGGGTLTLSAANTYAGTTTVNAGTLSLTGSIGGGTAAGLAVGGGTFSFGNGATSQSFTGLAVNAGQSSIVNTNAGSSPVLTLNAITRYAGGAVDFTSATATTNEVTTTTGNTNGIIGGWATQGGGATWAVGSPDGVTATPITGLTTYYTTTTGGNAAGNYSTGANVDVTSSPTLGGAITVNSLRFNTAAVGTLTLTGINILNSGGVLVTPTVGNNASRIAGGTIEGSSGGELIVNQWDTSNSLTIASIIANNGTATGLTKSGPGTLSLTTVNTYSGPTVVNGGLLFLNDTAAPAIKSSSSVTVNGTGLIGIPLVTNGRNLSTLFAPGVVIQGTGGVADYYTAATNGLIMDRANTYTGPTTWGTNSGGYYKAAIASAYDGNGNQISGAFGVNSAITFSTSGTNSGNQNVVLNDATNSYNEQVGSLVGGQTGVGVILAGGNLTIGGDNSNATFLGQISGALIPGGSFTATSGIAPNNVSGGITKIGTGNQTFSGSNFYVGATVIKGGILSVPSLGPSGDSATGSATSGSKSLTISGLSGSLALASGQVVEGVGIAQGTTVSSYNSGMGVVTLSTNTTTAVSGSVYFGTGNGLGISTYVASNLVLDGGTLQFTGAATSTDRLFTVGSTESSNATGTLDASGSGSLNFTNPGPLAYGTGTGTRTLNLTGTSTAANTLTPAIGDNSANGATGAVSVTKNGVGSWTLGGANSYSGGTTVDQGTLTSTVAGGFGTGNITVNPTGTANTSADAATLYTTGSIGSSAAVTVNTNSGTAIGTIYFNGSTPTIGSLAGTGNVVLNNATGTGLTTGSAGSTVFSGAISDTSGSSSLTKTGGSTFTLMGPNVYGGGTTVSGGTLYVNNLTNSGTGTGSVTVSAGTLGGTGNISGTVSVNSSATLQPGTTQTPIATLSTGALTLHDGSNFIATVNSDTASSSSQVLATTVSLADMSGALLSVTDLGTGANFSTSNVYTIVNAPSGLTGTFANFPASDDLVTANNGSTYKIEYYQTDVQLDAVSAPTPEPASLGLLGLGGLAMLRRRRKQSAITA